MKYSVVTFGCRVNQADSLRIEDEFRARGASEAAPGLADLVVVNTCSVTATADQGARQTIRRIARDNPAARIVVTGCYATRCASDVVALPNVVCVVGNDCKDSLVRDLDAAGGMPTSVRFGDGDGPCGAIEPGAAGRTAFTLRVQTGCEEACAYCIIPTTRGAGRSLPVAEVVRAVERAGGAGFREVALTGVHLGSYGRDLASPSSLLALLRALDTVRLKPDTTYGSATALDPSNRGAKPLAERGDLLFRISSLEPMDCSGEIVDLVAASDRFAPHFHLPLQHASDRVLAAMRRPYTLAQYSALVNEIRAKLPGASIGSDIIVGFPAETDDEFEELAAYLERAPLTHLHVFPYSDRPGTAATAMGGKVPGAVVRARASRIRDIGHRLAERFRDSQVGTTHRALTLEDGTLAVTGNYLKVRIPPGRTRNEWVTVVVTETRDTIRGNLVIG